MTLLPFAILLVPFLLKKKKIASISTISSGMPEGKGLFLDSLQEFDYTSLSEKIKELNIDWICVLYYDKEKAQLNSKNNGLLSALSSQVKIWLWSIPSPYDIDKFIELTKNYQDRKWVDGFIINLDEDFVKISNANTVLFSKLTKEIRKSIGIFTDPEVEIENLAPVFKFDAYQVHSGFSGQDNTNIDKKFPVFMDKTGKVDQSLSTYAFWYDPQNIDYIKNS